MSERIGESPAMGKPAIAVVLFLVIAAVAGWFFWSDRAPPTQHLPASATPEVPGPTPEQRIEHPVPAAEAGVPKAQLPELNDSDKVVGDALADAQVPAGLLLPGSLIRHIVVTVDNLPRQKVAVDKRPIAPPAGTFMAEGDELHATLDERNFQRYRPLVDRLGKIDMQRLAAAYLKFYPLFQKAYEDLGYPNGYFNDRLVKVIDLLLATPQVAGPIELVRPNVMYAYADPALESLPAGQKLLIRMGPDNAKVVKAKLMELRASVVAAAPKH